MDSESYDEAPEEIPMTRKGLSNIKVKAKTKPIKKLSNDVSKLNNKKQLKKINIIDSDGESNEQQKIAEQLKKMNFNFGQQQIKSTRKIILKNQIKRQKKIPKIGITLVKDKQKNRRAINNRLGTLLNAFDGMRQSISNLPKKRMTKTN